MNQPQHETWQYVIVWEFEVWAGKEEHFEVRYGPEGTWAQLFRHDDAYIGTELVRDAGKRNRYLTLDFWISRERYEAFREQNHLEYIAVDQECEDLTHSEREIGGFVRAISPPRNTYL